MSTNYYANLYLVGDETTPDVRLHLGRTSALSVIVDANVFPSFATMVHFFETTNARYEIMNEYGVIMPLDELKAAFYAYGPVERACQYSLMRNNPYNDGCTDSLDEEGFSVSTGEWF